MHLQHIKNCSVLAMGLLVSCSSLKLPSAAQIGAVAEQPVARVGVRDALTVVRQNKPLLFIDGQRHSLHYLKRLDSKTIDSISILYPRVSIVIYGKRGNNGVIVITPKKKKAGN